MPRKKKRKTRRPRPRIRKSSVPEFVSLIPKVLLIIIVLALAGVGVKAMGSVLFDSDYFTIDTIRVSGQQPDLLSRPITVGLASKKGVNIFRVDLKDCEDAIIYRHPELKDVKVRRVLPDTLEIHYIIRKPFLQIDSGLYYLVSDDAVILPEPQITKEPNLPIITGIRVSGRDLSQAVNPHESTLKRVISLIKDINTGDFTTRYSKIEKINMYDIQNPAIYMKNGTRIEIGEYSFKDKKGVLEEVLNELESRNKEAKIIDLRFEDVVVIPR